MVANAICARQLLDIAKGLQYLHSLDIPHGDLSGVGYPSYRSGCIPTACFILSYFWSPSSQSAGLVAAFRRRMFTWMDLVALF
jgi:hypothetical protein